MTEEAKKLKGVIVWFVNMYPDLGQSVSQTMHMIKDMNKPLLEKLAADGRYVCLMIPTTKEATRIEKVDYDSPFPRYMTKSHDIQKVGLSENEKKKPKQVFVAEEEFSFGGLINLFVNFHPEVKFEASEVLPLVQSINEEAFKAIAEDGQYQVMIVPTTKEASRIEKVDFEMPFPRFAPKAETNSASIVNKLLRAIEGEEDKVKEEDDDNFDEIEDEELEEEKE
jgi:hypothetical protein